MKLIGALAVLILLVACGGEPAAGPGPGAGGDVSARSGKGPDTSGLADVVLGKINADPTRQDMKASARMLDFKIVSVQTESRDDMGSAIVECAGTVEFDADADWGMNGLKKAGEPARFECRVEYANQGSGWQVFGPMGIYPL